MTLREMAAALELTIVSDTAALDQPLAGGYVSDLLSHVMGQAKAEWSLLKKLQSRQYDLIVHLTEHPRGAWLSRLLKPSYAVAPRVNGRGRFWKGSFTHFIAPIMGSGRRHVVEQNLDALRRIGIQPAPDQRALTFVPGTEADAHVAVRLQALGLEP